MTDLHHLAEQVSSVQDALLSELNPAREVRERLLNSPRKRSRRGWRWLALPLPAAAAVAMALRMHSPNPTYCAGNSRTPKAVGSWLAAPADGDLPLVFSDQSRVVLRAFSHARVVDLRDREVRMVLENGHVSVTVMHKKDRNWHLRAGPFDVAVKGTRFDVDWSPDREQFAVHTLEGRVEITGEQFASHVVGAGETLRAERMDGRYRFVETDLPQQQQLGLAPSAGSVSHEPSAASTERPALPQTSIVQRSAVAPAAPSWRELAATGHYREALDQAESDGFDGLCRSANLADLLALAEAARFAGRLDRARLALSSLRDRFRGKAAASVATFTLGRMAFDGSKDYLAAAKWFRTYLSEQPSGSLAREAAGRLIESLERGGDHATAQAAARDYLKRYPDGPQTRLAREVLAK